MSQAMVDVSVVICAYTEDRWADLLAAVESVQNQTRRATEIVVVVDHNPILLERVQASLPDVVAIENHERPGASGSKNSGAAAAKSAVVAFLDDDAEAMTNWIEQLCAGYEHSQVLGVGGSIEPLWPRERPAWFPEEFNWVVGCTYRGMPESAAAVRNLIGANMSFRREVFEKVNLYNEIGHMGVRPLGGSDPDFCIRVRRQWPQNILLYEPRARVYHHVSNNRACWRYFRLRCFNEGISKALLTRRVGANEGLASERTYTLHTLPLGVIRGLADTLLRGDLSGVARAITIIAGLVITTAGYVVGTLDQWVRARKVAGNKEASAWR
jgi:glucosyl-dolichyl phosphate glucuronosyltransferase